MLNVFYDADVSDEERREGLYRGDLYIYSPTATALEFTEFAAGMIREAFEGLDPETAQYELPVEEFADRLQKLKPAFIHHPDSKDYLQRILSERGCALEDMLLEVPKMRSSTSDNYLTAGIAYAWHPHRDTWYSAPPAQLNWWLPVFPLTAGNAMAFQPRYFDTAVENSSSGYNYYEWNSKHRGSHLTKFVNKDPRPLPKPTQPLELEPQLQLIVPPGGMIVFSANHMHCSVPNQTGKTRFSIDFRTAHMGDLRSGHGAPNVDSACTGTALTGFLQAANLEAVPEDIIEMYKDGTESRGDAVFAG